MHRNLISKEQSKPSIGLLWLSIAACACLILAFPSRLSAQQVAVSDNGIFYYVIIETDTGLITSQGIMDIGGIDQVLLAPNTNFTFYSLFTENLGVGFTDFSTGNSGLQTEIPQVSYYDLEDFDTDGDGLSDLREFIVGTNVFNADTDGDGINDGPEVLQGLNPLDGLIVETGIVGAGVVQGGTTICVNNNLAIVGQEEIGITVFNVTEIAEPLRIADVAIDGTIRDVDCSGVFVTAAAGEGGLAVIDISDPPAAFIARTLLFGSDVYSVSMNGDQAYVGLENGTIAWVDLQTGVELARIKPTTSIIDDLAIGRNVLYAISANRFYAINIRFGQVVLEDTINLSGSRPSGSVLRRIALGDTYALVNHSGGFMSVDLTDPIAPVMGTFNSLAQSGWKSMAANGSGLMVAAASSFSNLTGNHHVQLFTIGDTAAEATLLQVFQTTDTARAVAIYNGLAYVVDWKPGQQNGNLLVLNYLAYDSAGIPPSIELFTDAVNNRFEEGKVLTVTASVGDDVQVRNVQFLIDNEAVFTDGSFPFEYRFPTPLITPVKDLFTVSAIATDTGGNIAFASEITIQLTEDATPPFVTNVIPRDNGIVGEVEVVALTFSEVLDLPSLLGTPPPGSPPATLADPALKVFHEGPDGIVSTPDDVRATGTISFDENTLTAYFTFDAAIIPGTYIVRVQESVQDLAGNPMDGPFVSRFTQAGFDDADLDGLPDNVEVILGMDPMNPDTDGDGIIDGLEDNDGDGLVNTAEILFQTDPDDDDSNNNGILDGDEDSDNDGLDDSEEFDNSSDPYSADSDGDGFDDAGELAEGSSPIDPDSRPTLLVSSDATSYLNQGTFGLYGFVEIAIRSKGVSFQNLSDDPLPIGTEAYVSSSPTSYRNTSGDTSGVPLGTTILVASRPIAYENN